MKIKTKRITALVVMIIILLQSFSSLTNAAPHPEAIGIKPNQTYYIRNVNSGKYLDVPNSNSNNGTDLIQYSYNGAINQQFKVVRNTTTGDYSLIPMCATGSAVEITNTSSANDAIVQIWAKPSSDYMNSQKFRLARNSNGTYKILSYASNYTKAVVVKGASKSNDAAIIQYTDNGTTNGHWSFEPVSKRDADVYSFVYPGFDSSGAASAIASNLSSMGYNRWNMQNSSASSIYTWMQSNSISVFRGHGGPGRIVTFNDQGTVTGRIYADSEIPNSSGSQNRFINNLDSNALANLRCILYVGCNTGVSNSGYNLVDATYNKGAHFVLGTNRKTTTSPNNKWTKAFFDKANTGATIQECINYANGEQDYRDVLYYIGDVHQKLK